VQALAKTIMFHPDVAGLPVRRAVAALLTTMLATGSVEVLQNRGTRESVRVTERVAAAALSAGLLIYFVASLGSGDERDVPIALQGMSALRAVLSCQQVRY
jgi:hypothetical protein